MGRAHFVAIKMLIRWKTFVYDVTVMILFAHTVFADVSCDGVADTNGNCYQLQTSRKSWSDANATCSHLGLQLAAVKTYEQQQIIRQLLQTRHRISSKVWIGGRMERLYANSLLWRWASDKRAISAQGCYEDSTQTRDVPTQLLVARSRMTVEACISECASSQYKYAAVQAGTTCFCGDKFGLYGAVDTNADSNKDCDVQCRGNTRQICGGHGSNFIYDVNGTYSIWGFVRPNNWDGYQTCGILRQDIEFKMDDDDCGKCSYGFICGDIPTSACVGGAMMMNGACYYVSTKRSSWFTARMDCLSRGGDLVRITSYAVWSTIKAHIVATYSVRRYWIGLAGIYWYWSDGSEMKYYNWRITTSVDYTPSQIDKKCVMVNPNSDYQWIDEHCNVEAYFICMTADGVQAPSTASTTEEAATTTTSSTTTTVPLTTTSTPANVRTLQTTTWTLAETTETWPNNATNETAGSDDYGDDSARKSIAQQSADDTTTTLSPLELGMIVICCIIAIILILLIIAFIHYKKHSRNNQIKSIYLEDWEMNANPTPYNTGSTENLQRPDYLWNDWQYDDMAVAENSVPVTPTSLTRDRAESNTSNFTEIFPKQNSTDELTEPSI